MAFISSTLPLLIVLIVAAASYRPLRRMRALGATSPERARPLADIPPGEQRYLRSWIARGVVRESSPGMYWYDGQAGAAHQRRQLPWIAGLAAVLLLAAVALRWWSSRG